MIQPAAFRNIFDTFNLFDDWDDRYRYIIQLGQDLPALAESEKTEINRVHGCVSQVWLVPSSDGFDGEVVMTYRGGSDAMIVQGLVAVLLAIFSGRSATEIVDTDALPLLDQLGLREHLSAQRSNGLLAVVKRVQDEARKHFTHLS